MIELYYNKKDPRHILVMHDAKTKSVETRQGVKTTQEILLLEKHMNQIPSHMFMPSFSGIPRPVVFLDKKKIKDRWVYFTVSGLWLEIKNWCKENNIVCRGVYDIADYNNPDKKPDRNFQENNRELTLDGFRDIVNTWGLELDPRDYQVEAAWKILRMNQSMSQLATRAGKTLIAYMIFRYMIEYRGAKKILMIVPNINLVKQGVKDMKDYKEFFQTEEVWAEGEYCATANLTIGTFQSLIRRCVPGKKTVNKHYDPHFFDDYDVVCIDECHKTDCDSIKAIMKQEFIKNSKIIFGFSGTIPESGTIDNLGCQAILGPMIQDISTMALVNEGFLAKPIIRQIRTNYKHNSELIKQYIKYGEYLCGNDTGEKSGLEKTLGNLGMSKEKKLPIALRESRSLYDDNEYMQILIDLCKAKGAALLNLEQMIAMNSLNKINTILEILEQWPDKNGIIFAHNEEYVDFLYNHLKEVTDRPIYRIKGATSNKKREEIKKKMNTEDKNAVLVASYGTTSTGLTFSNIDFCIMAQSFKSKIINFQSIGRGLLKTDEKSEFYIYDLIDVLPTGRLKEQGDKKTKMYRDSNYEYKIIKR